MKYLAMIITALLAASSYASEKKWHYCPEGGLDSQVFGIWVSNGFLGLTLSSDGTAVVVDKTSENYSSQITKFRTCEIEGFSIIEIQEFYLAEHIGNIPLKVDYQLTEGSDDRSDELEIGATYGKRWGYQSRTFERAL